MAPCFPRRCVAAGPVLLALGALCVGGPAAADCPGFCAQPGATSDTDRDGVLDVHECWWCARAEGTSLWLDPEASDTDGDGARDSLDAYPNAPDARGELDFAASCEDPFPNGIVYDPEYSEEADKVAWITPGGASPRLWVADVVDGSFQNAVVIDSDVQSTGNNFHNGPEWLHGAGAGVDDTAIVYAKIDAADGLVKLRYATFDGAAWQTAWLGGSAPIPGYTPYGTTVPGDPEPYVLFGRDLDPDPSATTWWYLACAFPSCAGGPRPLWPGNLDPLDPMRLAEPATSGPPLLVGVDYRGPAPHQLLVVDLNGQPTHLTDDAPSKYGGWVWHDPASGRDLVVSSDMIYDSARTVGPGVMKVRTYPDGEPWQTIPVGPLDFPYLMSIEPFVSASGRSYLIYVASTMRYPPQSGPSRVLIAEVSDRPVGGSGVDPRGLIRRLDAGEGRAQPWKDPEGYTDGVANAVFIKDPRGGPGGIADVVRCKTGVL